MGCTKVVGEWDDRGPLDTFFWKGMRIISREKTVTQELEEGAISEPNSITQTFPVQEVISAGEIKMKSIIS